MEDDALSKLGNPCTVVPFIIKLPGMSNDGASKGIFQVLFYTGQTLPSNFEVEIQVKEISSTFYDHMR